MTAELEVILQLNSYFKQYKYFLLFKNWKWDEPNFKIPRT